MVTVREIDAAALESEAKAREWEQEFQALLNAPVMRVEQSKAALMGAVPTDERMARRIQAMRARVIGGQHG